MWYSLAGTQRQALLVLAAAMAPLVAACTPSHSELGMPTLGHGPTPVVTAPPFPAPTVPALPYPDDAPMPEPRVELLPPWPGPRVTPTLPPLPGPCNPGSIEPLAPRSATLGDGPCRYPPGQPPDLAYPWPPGLADSWPRVDR